MSKNIDTKTTHNIELNKEILKLTLSLYNIRGIPRNGVQTILNAVSSFIDESFIPFLMQEIECTANVQHRSLLKDVQEILEKNKNHFGFVSTEHRRFKLFEQTGFFYLPQDYIIGSSSIEKTQGGLIISEANDVYAAYVFLQNTLKLFFELPGLFNEVRNYVDYLKKK